MCILSMNKFRNNEENHIFYLLVSTLPCLDPAESLFYVGQLTIRNHRFRYTTASRVEKSCNWFARGVWGKSVLETIKYPDPSENPLIRVIKLFKALHII